MAKHIMIEGKPAIVPDDATDEEINQLFPAKPAAPKAPRHASDLGGPDKPTGEPSWGDRFMSSAAGNLIAGPLAGPIQALQHPLEALGSIPMTLGGLMTGNAETYGGVAAGAPYSMMGGGVPELANAHPIFGAGSEALKSGVREILPSAMRNVDLLHPMRALPGIATDVGNAARRTFRDTHEILQDQGKFGIPGQREIGTRPVTPDARFSSSQYSNPTPAPPAPTNTRITNTPTVAPIEPIRAAPTPMLGPALTPEQILNKPSSRFTPGQYDLPRPKAQSYVNPISNVAPAPPAPMETPMTINPVASLDEAALKAQKQAAFEKAFEGIKPILENKGAVPPGYNWGEGNKGPGFRERWDEGSGPTIQSTVPQTRISSTPAPGSPLNSNPRALETARKMAEARRKGKK